MTRGPIIRLRLIATSDLHAHLEPYDYYRDRPDDTVGLSRLASLIDAARAQATNALLLDNGDFIQGNPLGDLIGHARGLGAGEVHPMIRAMNLLGYDAVALGNHEFNYGLPFLERVMAGADFPIVAANVVRGRAEGDIRTAVPYVTPYVLLTRALLDDAGRSHAVTIGVVGVCPPAITTWDRPHLAGRIDAFDMTDALAAFVPEMRERGADLVVVLAHTGITGSARAGMDENAAQHIARIPGIDALVTGHQHQVFPGPAFAGLPGVDLDQATLHGVPTVMPGFWGSHLGVIDLDLVADGPRWRVGGHRIETRAIYRRAQGRVVASVATQPRLVDAVAEEHEATLAYVRRPVGWTDVALDTYFAQVCDTAALQFVADAQIWGARPLLEGTAHDRLPILSAVAPFKAGGRAGSGFYTDVAAGALAIKNIADLYLYPNTLQAVRVTGAELAGWLERSAGQFARIAASGAEQALIDPAFPSFNFDVIKGVTYAIDVSVPARFDAAGQPAAPDARRIRDLAFEGRPVGPDDLFVVVTNNYRAAGGGAFPGADGRNVILEAPDPIRDVMIRYVQRLGTIGARPSGNWRLLPVPGADNVVFDTAPQAIGHPGMPPNLRPIGEGPEGFARFRIDLSN